MPSEKHLIEELHNVGATGRRGLHPGDTITHASAYELERRGLIARDPRGWWVITVDGERLLAEQLAAVRLGEAP